MANNLFQRFAQASDRAKTWRFIVAVLLITLTAGLIDGYNYYNKGTDWLAAKTNNTIVLPKMPNVPFLLGLDLMGGTHLVYQADVSKIEDKEKANALEGARDVIERRVNVFGVSEPVVQTNKSGDEYQIIVELAGIKDVNQAIKMIGETPILEFKEPGEAAAQLTEDQKKQIQESAKKAEKTGQQILGKLSAGGNFSELAKEYSDDQDTKSNGGDLGYITEASNASAYSYIKNLEPGKISSLLKTDIGYEIYKLEDKRAKKSTFSDEAEKEIKAAHVLICYEGSENCTSKMTKEQANAKIKELKQKATPANFKQLAKENSTEPGAKDTGGELGWFGKGAMVEPFEQAAYDTAKGAISYVVETKFGYHLIFIEDVRDVQEYKVSKMLFKSLQEKDFISAENNWKNTELTGKNLKKSTIQFDPNTGSPQVSLEFDDEGAKMFEDVTARNVGKQVAIFLDNYVISAPTVDQKITGGNAVISGSFNLKDAKLLSQRLNAGALPVPINLVNQQIVGPSLGQKSIHDSLLAGMIGFALVALFMIFYYRLPGLISVLALAIYSILVLALFKVIKVTMTLSGMAGFILSIGMAVDANVLIFERIKEELRKGKTLNMSIEEGFRRAWSSIRDSNISSLITCAVLYYFYAGTIRGFALTLAIGILVSLFSAITVTRMFLKVINGEWAEKKKWLFGVSSKDNNNQ